MLFFIFIALLFALSLFYRREHRAFLNDIKTIYGQKSVIGDWRLIENTNGIFSVKRSFSPTTRFDMLRYAMPIITFCVLLFVFENWMWAFAYVGLCAVKWFIVTTYIDTTTDTPKYAVKIFNYTLFEEDLG